MSGNASAAIALAEGKLQPSAYWPNKAGLQLKFEVEADGKRYKYDFGAVRATLQLTATGFVGASAVGAINLEFKKPKAQTKSGSGA